MKKLENLNEDLFEPFKEDEIKDLSNIRGGGIIGQSGGHIYGELFCWRDELNDDGSILHINCEILGGSDAPDKKPKPDFNDY
jgi:hypothetical protein